MPLDFEIHFELQCGTFSFNPSSNYPVCRDKIEAIHSISIVLVFLVLAIFILTERQIFIFSTWENIVKWGKYAKMRVKMLKKRLFFVPTTLTLFTLW